MKVIFLVGYMGSGKSTLGKQVAELLKCNYLDSDSEIEKIHQASINEMIKNRGEAWFRYEEQGFLSFISNLNQDQNSICIVSCGGGFPCYNDMMSQMNEIGTTIYLKLSAFSLFKRLKFARSERPLLNEYTDNNLFEKISSMLSSREPIYLKANHTLDLENKTINESVQALRMLINDILT